MMRMQWMIAVALLTTLVVQAQTPEDDPIARHLFPPDLIMAHGRDLGLQEGQRNAIKDEVQKAQSKFFDYQWQMREESERMIQLLQQATLDEARILEQADKVMKLEREIKRTHLSLLIRLRNLLTPDQRARLETLRAKSR